MKLTFYFAAVLAIVLFYSSLGKCLIITSPTTTSTWTMYTTVCISWYSRPGDGAMISRIDVVSPQKTKTIFPAVPLSKGRHSFVLSGIEINNAVYIQVTTDIGVVQRSGNFKVGLAAGDRDCRMCAPPMQTCVSTGAGCESDSSTDVTNCGSCGNACSSNHVPSVSCSGGTCNGACESGWTDCNNNKLTDGCEIHTDVDTSNCGTCGTVCSTNNINRACAGGSCSAGTCTAGWSDCNNNKQLDGCEIHSAVDTSNCGTCGTVCSNNNINPQCSSGSCSAGTCFAGWADCNNNKQLDGCEIHTDVDVLNCGSCNTVCSTNHITRACSGGSCSAGTCAAGWADCNNNKLTDGCEISLLTDPNNCAACNGICSSNNMATRTCSGGVCNGNCNTGFADCNNNKLVDGCEINTQTDANNCGACTNVCSNSNMATRTCGSGICNGNCNAGFADCNNNKLLDGCEINTQTDANNCGACTNVCSNSNMATRTCGSGICNGNCNSGFADCNNNKLLDGCEINTQTDVNNCGGCSRVCSGTNIGTRTCTSGTCTGGCNAGFADCNNNKLLDGCEINTQTDANNCGSCTAVCSGNNMATRTCGSGVCNGNCNAGFADCNNNKFLDGCEINTQTDANNCGACTNICSNSNMATRTCGSGICNGNCNAGFADCNNNKLLDGCEINTQTDVNNCGGCSRVCSGTNIGTRTCTSGTCTGGCNAGFADCNNNKLLDGCEVSLPTDPNNCGGCSVVCSSNNMATRTCGSGTCNGNCNAGFADCNNNKQTDGCEINTQNNVNNCGGCNIVCSSNHVNPACSGGSCSAGTCHSGWTDCNNNKQIDGCEINTASDMNNCGTCGRVCPAVPNGVGSCSGGNCIIASCNAGYLDCNGVVSDGCEVYYLGDVNNCGGCNVICSSNHINRACSGGSCSAGTCHSTWSDCNGNKQTDGCECSSFVCGQKFPDDSTAVPSVSWGGYCWAWASPCSGDCGQVVLTGTRGNVMNGWRHITCSELSAGPPKSAWNSGSSVACASSIFDDTHLHCDWGDNIGCPYPAGGVLETWIVKPIP